MKPKLEEVRRILRLALGCWNDFLNELNNILLSKSHLRGRSFFDMIYAENPCDEIREAIFLIDSYWNRVHRTTLVRAIHGLTFSKPHAEYMATATRKRRLPASSVTSRLRVSAEINQVEIPIWFFCPRNFSIRRPTRANKLLVLDYDKKMLLTRTYPDPYIRAGIDLRLIERGFKQ